MTTTINYNEKKKIHANTAATATATAKNANDATIAITGFIGLSGINDDTTLNELIALARNNAIEKPKATPKFATLRNKCRCGEYHCVASLKNSMFDLRVYDCGYAGYESYGRTTVIDLDEIFTVTYPSNFCEVSLEASAIGNSSWGYALAILSDEQIELQQNKEKAHDFVSENDNSGISADSYDLGCAFDCGGLRGNKKINQPALSVHIDDPETAYIKKETKREIRWALSKTRADMTEKQAEAFRLYYDEDMTEDEIGKILSISHQAVSYRLSGVEQKLRRNLEQFL